MKIRQTKHLLHGSACLLAASALCVAGASVLWPIDVTVGPLRASRPASSPTTQPGSSLSSYESLWRKSFRQSLVAQATSAPQAQRATTPKRKQEQPPAVPLTLVGTIGNSVALLQSPGGAIEATEVGDGVSGAKVVAIRPAEVVLAVAGQTVVLRKLPSTEGSDYVKPSGDVPVEAPQPSSGAISQEPDQPNDQVRQAPDVSQAPPLARR